MITKALLAMPASSRFQRPRISFDDDADDDGNSHAVRSLPQLVDYNDTHNPGAVFAHQAIKQTGDGQKRRYEIVTVTHGQLAGAVRRCRLFLLERVPLDWTAEVIEPSQEWPAKPRPISLFMESDVHYFAMLIACLSLGIPVGHFALSNNVRAAHQGLRESCLSCLQSSARKRLRPC